MALGRLWAASWDLPLRPTEGKAEADQEKQLAEREKALAEQRKRIASLKGGKTNTDGQIEIASGHGFGEEEKVEAAPKFDEQDIAEAIKGSHSFDEDQLLDMLPDMFNLQCAWLLLPELLLSPPPLSKRVTAARRCAPLRVATHRRDLTASHRPPLDRTPISPRFRPNLAKVSPRSALS